ncbi:MAG TPA: adenylyl cyclase, partial [Ktedonobacterales bacterium]
MRRFSSGDKDTGSQPQRQQPSRLTHHLFAAALALATTALLLGMSFSVGPTAAAQAAPSTSSGQPDFGPNVSIFNPSMPLSAIQATVDAVANQQVSNQFGTQRYALLFEPGTYGSSAAPLNFQVGYYTMVAGLGQNPGDVIINGSINAYNQCFGVNNCTALVNFWRSLSNLTINVTNPTFGCHTGEFWAVSQASPMRRVQVNGLTT